MTKIDDAMVERAAKAAYEADGPKSGTWEMAHDGSRDYWRKFIRAGLEAALTPQEPEIPEIPVSEGMNAAGNAEILAQRGKAFFSAARVYRAMESARRKEAETSPCKRCLGTGYDMLYGPHPGLTVCTLCKGSGEAHRRRKDDPKKSG